MWDCEFADSSGGIEGCCEAGENCSVKRGADVKLLTNGGDEVDGVGFPGFAFG